MDTESAHNADTHTSKMQGLLAAYLSSSESSRVTPDAGHLDDDSLAAFVEGRLAERESRPMISHLVNCGFCRRVTAELVRLDIALAQSDALTVETASETPTKVSDVLSGILAKIFGPGDAAVFAHGEDEENKDEAGDEKGSGEQKD